MGRGRILARALLQGAQDQLECVRLSHRECETPARASLAVICKDGTAYVRDRFKRGSLLGEVLTVQGDKQMRKEDEQLLLTQIQLKRPVRHLLRPPSLHSLGGTKRPPHQEQQFGDLSHLLRALWRGRGEGGPAEHLGEQVLEGVLLLLAQDQHVLPLLLLPRLLEPSLQRLKAADDLVAFGRRRG